MTQNMRRKLEAMEMWIHKIIMHIYWKPETMKYKERGNKENQRTSQSLEKLRARKRTTIKLNKKPQPDVTCQWGRYHRKLGIDRYSQLNNFSIFFSSEYIFVE